MKAVKIIVGLLLILVIGFVVTATFFMGPLIKTAVEGFGPKVLGVPVQLARVHVSPLTGRVRFEHLVIGNPSGFKADHAFQIDKFAVELVPSSVFSKRILIRDITIDSPDIQFEQTLAGNNFSKIMDNLKSSPSPQTQPPKPQPDQSPKKSETTVVIDNFLIANGKIRVSMPGVSDVAAPIPLPSIHLTDIGKESGGTSVQDAAQKIFSAILTGVMQAVTASGNVRGKSLSDVGKSVVGDNVQQLGTTAKDAGKAMGDDATKAVEGVKNLFLGK